MPEAALICRKLPIKRKGGEQFDRALEDAEFGKEEVVDIEYEVDETCEITQVEDQDEPSL